MTFEILLVLALLAAVTTLFMLEWASVDIVTLLMLIALVLSRTLTPEEAFSGFANEIIIILSSIFVLSAALAQTGVMDRLADWISRLSSGGELRVLLIFLCLSAVMSAFLSNTTTTAVLVPTVMALCRKADLAAGRMLMPLAFASMLGGTCTLIGTSTNLAASGLIAKLGLAPFSMFEFSGIGIVVAVLGVVYLLFVGRLLLPDSKAQTQLEDYGLNEYLAELKIEEGSQLIGRTLKVLDLPARGVNVAQVIRGKHHRQARSNTRIREGDVLVVSAGPQDLLAMAQEGVRILEPSEVPREDLERAQFPILETVILPGSAFLNKTLKALDLRRRYRVSALGVYRRSGEFAARIRNIRLRVGDVLLLQGRLRNLGPLLSAREILLLNQSEPVALEPRRGAYAVGALLTAVVLSGLQVVPVSIAFLLGGLLVVLLRCVSVDQIYELIEWRLIILIGGMTSFGLAMQKSGAGAFLADAMASGIGWLGTTAVLAAFGALTMLLTQPMSNAAAALVVLPVALPTALHLGIEPRVMAVVVTLSASLSFVAPLEPASLLVYGPGKYRFRDFVKTGLPLSLMTLLLLVWLVPLLWS